MTTTTSIAGPGFDTNTVAGRVDAAANAAHQATDNVAGKTNAQVGRFSDSAHAAVDGVAAASKSAAESAAALAEQAKQVHSQLTESATASIRANPIIAVGGALAVGYLLARITRP
jgi:hypothetical protein